MGTTARSKTIAVGFKASLPFWLKCQLDQGLFGPVVHNGYSERPSFVWITGFRDVDPTDRRGDGLNLRSCPTIRIRCGGVRNGQAHLRQGFSSPCCLAIPVVLPGIWLNKNEAAAVAARQHA